MNQYELQQDVEFLLPRALKAGRFGGDDGPRDFGASSNSIVSIAYGVSGTERQALPFDQDDLNACLRMWEKLPDHRKTEDARRAIQNAKSAIK